MTKLISPIEASELLAPGSTVFIQGGIGEPTSLLNALVCNPSAGKNVNFISVMVPGVNNYRPESFHDTATFSTFFVFSELHASFQSGKTRFLPLHYSEIIPYIELLPTIDTVLIQTSPPDSNGQCSLGPTVDFVPALLTRANTVIAEINSAMPHTSGSPSIAYRDIHYAVEACHSLPSIADYKASPETERIARNVVSLIDDGDTLQFGIGNIPDAILSALSSHRGLGIHSGMITKAAATLIDSGVFTGENKAIDSGEHITGFALGDERFYQWAANCKSLKFRPVSYTHDIRIISALKNFVSINSAVQVDLFGQVNAEMVNNRQISGTGGALDFIRGARLSHNGRSIIALPATAAKGSQSRITARLGDQSIVSIPRTDVDYVVTEYGIASLAYKSTAERAEALINIAAPQFRDELAAQFAK
ncbi:acetyl-CoA hydrolase/transferase family protein [Zhongshania borealis]